MLSFFAQDSGTHNLVYANADLTKAAQARKAIAFCDHWKTATGKDPVMLVTGWAARRGALPKEDPFPRGLPPNHADAFQRTWLSSDVTYAVRVHTEDIQHRLGVLHFAGLQAL